MGLRWFTPEVEVVLCGHATLATAHILRELGKAQVGDKLIFHTLSGELSAKLEEQAITLDFPGTDLQLGTEANWALIEALGLDSSEVLSFNRFSSKDLIEIKTEAALMALAPDFTALKKLEGRGVAVTTQGQRDGLDCISRYFAPWVGIDEDPVTGSTHCGLTDFWTQKLNKSQLLAFQASARGGYLSTEKQASGRISLTGHALTVLSGKLRITDEHVEKESAASCLENLLSLAKRKALFDLNNPWYQGPETYLHSLKEEVDEVVEELPRERQCYLEDELADLLWNTLNTITALEQQSKVSAQSVVARTTAKYQQRIAAIEAGGNWAEVKAQQKAALAIEWQALQDLDNR